jgi:tetratricopeptide (TPR) repeat protein
MTLDIRHLIRIAKRVTEATGYFELGMIEHALDCLEGLGELGPFEAQVQLLRGEALRMQHRYDDAATALKTAARKFPSPYDKPAWFALSLCYRQAGDTRQAIPSLARARGAHPLKRGPDSLEGRP